MSFSLYPTQLQSKAKKKEQEVKGQVLLISLPLSFTDSLLFYSKLGPQTESVSSSSSPKDSVPSSPQVLEVIPI